MPDESLLLMLKEIRKTTIDLLYGVSDDQARFAAPGLVNTILWHAGHAFVVVEHLGIAPLADEPPVVPDGWFETFSWKSQPATVTHWPAVAEVVAKLRDQEQRLAAGLEWATPEKLAEPVGDPARGRTVRYSVLHGLHDEARHQGEMYLLKKLAKKTAER
jgi:hypothetical protein